MARPPIITVGAFWKDSKKAYFLKWKDPVTRKVRTKKTDLVVRNKRNSSKADRLAESFQVELNDSFAKPSESMTWEDFLSLYRTKRLSKLSADNRNKWNAAVAIFDEVWPTHVFGVLSLDEITAKLLVYVEAEMESRLSPGSVSSYAATLRAGFSWAAKTGLMPMLPPRPPSSEEYQLPAMRLSPIVKESLETMEKVAWKFVGRQHAKGIADYMRCLWLCGGRLVDPLYMHAYRLDCHHPIVLEGDNPMFGWVTRQKNKRDQIAPITLDFAEWILPRCSTDDWLFNPTCEHGRIECKRKLSSLISAIGKAANVVAEPGRPPKTATAKHFRSSFITRWSRRGMPIERISAIARHSSPKTTEKYYLAPPDEAMMTSFVEKEWIGDQTGDQKESDDQKTPSL